MLWLQSKTQWQVSDVNFAERHGYVKSIKSIIIVYHRQVYISYNNEMIDITTLMPFPNKFPIK